MIRVIAIYVYFCRVIGLTGLGMAANHVLHHDDQLSSIQPHFNLPLLFTLIPRQYSNKAIIIPER